jgi:hypothetical protein
MKNIFFLFIILSALSFTTVSAGNEPFNLIKKSNTNFSSPPSYKKEIIEGGFYFHLGVMLPTKNYYMPKGVRNTTDERFGIGGGLELGDYFGFSKVGKNASIGLRVTLLNALYTTYSKNGKTTDQVIHGSAFNLGPNFSIGLGDVNAIDIYYMICPTYMYNLKDTASYTASGSWGLIHEFGLGYRYNLLSIGATYNLGNVKYVDAETNDKYMKHCMDHFRFYIGMMF